MEECKKKVIDRSCLAGLRSSLRDLERVYDCVCEVEEGDLTLYFEHGCDNPDPKIRAKLYSLLVQLSHCMDVLGDINWDLDCVLPDLED